MDFWRAQIPGMVSNLEKSAVTANTTSERLALQLQSIELQISMKTGQNPKPVGQLLQEAAPSDADRLERERKSAERVGMDRKSMDRDLSDGVEGQMEGSMQQLRTVQADARIQTRNFTGKS